MSNTTDVIVVGGGINGVSIAYNLARRGVKVTLVEKTFIAGGPTGRSSALIRQHYSNEVSLLIDFLFPGEPLNFKVTIKVTVP